MTIIHRTFSAAFDAGRATRLPDVSRARTHGGECANSQSYWTAGVIMSSPWEGLYMEYAETAEPSAEEPFQASTDLERFLSSLMHGE